MARTVSYQVAMKIEKKIWPQYFDAIASGEKTFELRLADFECKPEDVLVLREWNPKSGEYTGRELEKKVAYIVKTKGQKFWSEEDVAKHGFQILGFK